MTEIQWAELHAPLFLAGTNLGQKLDPTKRQGLKLAYDEDKRHMYIEYNGKTARVPETSVLSMVEGIAKKPEFAKAPVKPIEAQVSSPQSHVFAGLGKGDSGQSKTR